MPNLFAQCGYYEQGSPVQSYQLKLNIKRKNDIAIACCGEPSATLGQWRQLMEELNDLDCSAVIDARSLDKFLIEIEAYLLALQTNEQQQLRSHRMAFVMTDDLLVDLDFFVASARNVGLKVESFDSIDTATAWATG